MASTKADLYMKYLEVNNAYSISCASAHMECVVNKHFELHVQIADLDCFAFSVRICIVHLSRPHDCNMHVHCVLQ